MLDSDWHDQSGPHFTPFKPPSAVAPSRWPSPRPYLYWRMINNFIEAWPRQVYDDLIVDCGHILPGAFLLNDPAAIRHVFRNAGGNYVPSRQQVRVLTSLFGASTIATTSGAQWAADRQIYEAAVAPEKVAGIRRALRLNAEDLAAQWRTETAPVLIDPGVSLYSLRGISTLALSWRAGGYVDSLAQSLSLVDKSIGRITLGAFLRLNVVFPIGARGRAEGTLRDLESRIRTEISARRTAGSAGDDLLGLYLCRQAVERHLSDAVVVANVIALLSSGYDTTAAALGWFLFLLAGDQALQDEVRCELAPFAAEESDGARTAAIAAPVARAVFQETTRLYPSLPLLARRAEKADQVGAFAIPAGSTVFVSPYVIHRHRRFWRQPDLFDPFRFLGARRKEHSEGAYMPFGTGQRTCVGMQLAYREVFTAAAVVLKHLTLAIDENHPVSLSSRIGLRARHGLKLHMQPRR